MNLDYVLIGIIVLVVLGAAAIAWDLHRKGVANKDLLKQGELKVLDAADAFRDRVVSIIAEESAKAAAKHTLRSAYFDEADFMQDIGRLPAAFKQAITLNGNLVQNGDSPAIAYTKQPNGNVIQS